MQRFEPDSHLSRIETHWTAVFQAHRGPSEDAVQAQSELVRRYGGAVHRYLLASLQDADAADELSQEFALRFLRGDFRNADPGKGRFRDFLKRAVYHLMIDHHRARRAHARPLDEAGEPEDLGPSVADLDAGFVESWRDELLARTWAALARYQDRTGRPFFAVLKARVGEPDLDSAGLAERLSARLGKAVDLGWVRVTLHRARDQFIDLLLKEVAATLQDPSPAALVQELIELGLYERCRSTMKRRGLASS
jgi:DNA-directed RNA polymerase specialized sigma24 family protein